MLRDQGTVAIIFIFFFFSSSSIFLCPSFYLKEERGRSRQTLFDIRSIASNEYRANFSTKKNMAEKILFRDSMNFFFFFFPKENITVVVENSMKEKNSVVPVRLVIVS